MENRIDHLLYQWLLDLGLAENIANGLQFILELLVLVLLCFIADKIAKKVFVRIITTIVRRTTFEWDDILLENKVFYQIL